MKKGDKVIITDGIDKGRVARMLGLDSDGDYSVEYQSGERDWFDVEDITPLTNPDIEHVFVGDVVLDSDGDVGSVEAVIGNMIAVFFAKDLATKWVSIPLARQRGWKLKEEPKTDDQDLISELESRGYKVSKE